MHSSLKLTLGKTGFGDERLFAMWLHSSASSRLAHGNKEIRGLSKTLSGERIKDLRNDNKNIAVKYT